MNRKSWFCGFGTGILFAAIILGISFMVRTSDSFVKSRAKELGMVYAVQDSERVLDSEQESVEEQASSSPEASPEATPGKSSTAAPKNTQAPKPTASPDSSAAKKPTASPDSSSKDIDMKAEKDKIEKNIRDEEKKLVINVGEMSSDVSRSLEKLGVIESASDFDKYLEKNGYSGGINAGTYSVSQGDTYSQLAKKITGK